jgi:hypothetical protein
MAEAVILGSILASGASAAGGITVGAVTAAGLIGPVAPLLSISAGTLGTISAGLGLAGTALSMFSGASQADAAYDAQIAASRAELEAGKARFAEGELSAQRENTQAAIEESERQRRLRRVLAAQRAQFAGGGADIGSGSLQRIQEDTIGEINRESNLAAAATQDRVSSINRQGLGILAASKGRASSLINQANVGRAESRSNTINQLGGLATGISDFGATLKK